MLKFYIPALFWGLLILALSAAPGNSMPNFSFLDFLSVDKIGHLVFYAILVSLSLWGHYRLNDRQVPPLKSIGWIVFIAICYGISIEIMQYAFFSGRYFDVLDIIANIIGSMTGTFSIYLLKNFKF